MNVLDALYSAKQAGYFECPRPELLPFVPESACKILDVGCGAAGFSGTLKQLRKAEVWGVELNKSASEIAQERLDKVFHGSFGPELGLPGNYFDCIMFNDVLEHMLDPTAALKLASSLLSENGVVVASIPNIGHFPTIWRLVVRGEWDYKESGILDKTHLRFFTRSSIAKLFDQSGFEVRKIEGISKYMIVERGDRKLWWQYRIIALLPFKGVGDMRYLQFAVVAGKKWASGDGMSR